MSKQFATEGTAQLLSKQGIRGDLTCEPWSFRNGCPIKKIDNISHVFWEMHIFFAEIPSTKEDELAVGNATKCS